MSPKTVDIMITLLILLCSFIHDAIGNDIPNMAKSPFIQINDILTELSPVSSYTIPIKLALNSEWMLSSDSNSHTKTDSISLQSFLHSLSNQYYDNQNPLKLIDIQLHIINTQYLSLPQFKLLFDLIKQSKISISNLIVPYEIALSQSQISQIMSIKESTKIKTKISFYILSSSSDQNTLKSNINTNTNSRRLLSNESDISLLQPLMTQIDIIEKESWVCEPWPIYVGFFSGIGVTVLITLAINFTLGDNDKQLNSALERIITAGIDASPNRNRSMDPYGAIEIVGGPTEHKRNRTNSAIILSLNKVDSGMGSTLGSPKSRSRSVHITARQGSIGTHNRKYTNELSWIYDLNNRNNHGRSEKHMGLKRIHPRPPHVHEHGENHKTMTSELRLKSASSDSILYHAMQTRHLQDRNSSSNDENINNNSMEMKYDNQNNATDRSGDDKSRESLDLDVELQNLPRPTSIDTKMEDNHNYLKLSRGNLQTTPAITPAMTPNSDRYLSAARHSSSISSLTKQDSTSTTSHDSPLRTIAKALVDNEIKYTGNSIIIHQDAINKSDDDLDVDDQESLTKNMNDSDDEEEKKSNNTKAANIINLSPIHENNVNFKEYKKKKMNIEVFSYGTTGPDYVKRPNGKAVRVGFKSPKTYSRRPISPLNDPYNFKCNVIHSDNDTNSNETTIVDDETEDDGMDAADDNSEESEPGEEVESGLYSDNSNDIDNEVP